MHEFIALHIDGGVAAGCSCGWTSPHTHAVQRYARDDHAFHVDPVQPPTVRLT